jgi:hypothetical protein
MAMARSFNYTKRQDIANSSVRVTVEKDTLKMCIEYTEFSKKILDKFTEL